MAAQTLPPGDTMGRAAEGLTDRLRHIWPLLSDGYPDQLPDLEELPAATVERLGQQVQQLIAGSM